MINAVDFLNENKSLLAGLSYTRQQDLASALHGKSLVQDFDVNLFAAKLESEVSAGSVPQHVLDFFRECFPLANSDQFVGN